MQHEVNSVPLKDVVLVCHSWGGLPCAHALDRQEHRISRVVFMAAMVPVGNESYWSTSPAMSRDNRILFNFYDAANWDTPLSNPMSAAAIDFGQNPPPGQAV